MEQFDTLLDGLPAAAQGTWAGEFNGSVDDARTAAREARQRMADAGSRLAKAQGALTEAIDKLRRTGGGFSKISGPVKDRVMHDPADVLGRNAAGLAVQLRLRPDLHVAWGIGGSFEQSVLSLPLPDPLPRYVRYFGDLDLAGLRIAARVPRQAAKAGLPRVLPPPPATGSCWKDLRTGGGPTTAIARASQITQTPAPVSPERLAAISARTRLTPSAMSGRWHEQGHPLLIT